MPVRLLVLAGLSLALATGAEAQSQKQTRDRYLITAEEAAGASANSVLDVIEQLRPQWLRRDQDRARLSLGAGPHAGISRPEGETVRTRTGDPRPEEPPRLKVFVDETEGDLDDLKRVPREQIGEIRYLTGSEAQTRWGPRFAAGVILLRLRTGG
jgi:hypothetical protein